jgi:hypothetical protein
MKIYKTNIMYKTITENQNVKSTLEQQKFPFFTMKLSDLITRFQDENNNEMVKALDDILVDAWDYIDDIRPDLGYGKK